MLSFIEFLIEKAGGASAGSHELVRTGSFRAYAFAKTQFKKEGNSINADMPEFTEHYEHAQTLAKQGHTKRKDMPVIATKQLKDFQRRLANGSLDIRNPYAPKGSPYFTAGKEEYDGQRDDDKVKITSEVVQVSKLTPIQKQIYIDKSIRHVADDIKASTKFLSKAQLVVSSDLRIIDGHHRWLTAMLIDPRFKIHVVKIDLQWKELLKIAMEYSDQKGNKRNK